MRHPLAVSLLASLAALTACGKVRESPAAPTPGTPQVPIGDPGGGPGGPVATIRISDCTACHGTPDLQMANADPLVAAAPPRSLASMTDSGAHRAHLVDGPFRKAVECASCHLVPTTPPPHQAQRWGKVTFSRLATQAWTGARLDPAWDGASGTCASTYCHGNFKNGAKAAPAWTAAGSVGCGSCHGDGTSPLPGGNHTRSTACGGCHDSAYSWNGTTGTVNLSLHMNGQLDLTNMTCTSCHGTAGRLANAGIAGTVDANLAAAPPVDSAGSATSVKVGVHQAHLNPTSGAQLFRPLVCTDCHPDNAGNTAHSNGTIDVNLATIAGVAPSETPSAGNTAASCATYCHGAKWPAADAHKGARTTWSWNGPAATCGDCHADPPTSTAHAGLTSSSNCGSCHPGYTATTVNVALHINGVLDGGGGHPPGWKEPDQHGTGPSGALASGLTPCTTCHIGFGSSTGSAATSCDACHATPSAYGPYATGTYPDHADWKTECTFCHGGRGNATGAPPRNTHVISSDLTTAQPTTDATIGAHASHVTAAHGVSLAFDCTACHATRWSSATDPGHVDKATADVVFNPVGPTANPGSYARPGCSSTYCHGNFAGGAGTASIQWTGTFGGAFTLSCASCHASPPALTAATHHPQNLTCASCHPAGASQSAMTGAAVATHVDGTVTLTRSGCTLCHGDLTATAVANTDGRAAPGFDAAAASTRGETAATAPAVGAHAAHLTGTRWRASSIACNECHVVPAANDRSHATGAGTGGALATLTFGTLARTGTLAPSYAGSTTATTNASAGTCSNTYCHGGKWTGNAAYAGTNLQPGWTAGSAAAACGTCHQAPPTSSAHASVGPTRNCGDCHTGYNCTSGNLAACTVAATHINGQLDVANLTCSSCHGDTTRTPVASATAVDALGANLVKASPPVDAGHGAASTGAHLAHVNQGDAAAPGPLSNALACTNCHPVPTSTGHSNGTIDVTFGGLSTTGGAAPAPYNLATHTCASTYCHGNFVGGAGANAIAWTGTAKLGCTSCHGNPPPASGGHPQNDACGSCHGAGYSKTGATAGTVNVATHVNGTVDLVGAESCTSCHGTAGRASVAGADANQAAAPPADTAGLTSSTAVGAHLAHVNQSRPTPLSAPFGCAVCHPVPTQNRHANGTTQVTFTGVAVTGGIANASYTSPSCTATYCHGNFTGGAGTSAAPAWDSAGAQLACNACHGAPPGPTSTTVHHPPNPNCASCHTGYTATTVARATHVNGTVDHTPATGCTQCHGDLTAAGVANTDVRAAPASNANAVDAHGDPAATTSARGIGAHAKHLTGTTWRSTPIACSECHGVPAAGDTSHANGDALVTFGALAKTAWAGQPSINPAWNGAGGAATLTCSNTYCHGNFPNGQNAAPTWATPSVVGCGSCHLVSLTNGPGGTHPTLSGGQTCGTCHGGTYTNSSVDPVLHMNGKLDGGGESGGGSACAGCHATIFSAMNGGVTHTSKHAFGNVAGTNDSPTDSGVTWANPLSNNAPAARSCVNMCHGDHPHDLTSPATATHENNAYADASTSATRADGTANRIGVGGTGGAVNRMKTDYDGTQANGGLCVSCHQNPVDAARPAVAKTAFDAAAHDYTSNTVGGTTFTWSYVLHDGGLFARDCTKCHASRAEGTTPQASATGSGTAAVHYSDDASLLAGTKRPAGTAAGFVCYNCHGSTAAPANGAQGNRSGKDIQSQIAHATTAGQSGHPADSDSVHDTVAEQTNAVFGNALGVAAGAGQRHASCLDCHDPHEAKAGTHAQGTNVAGPPLQGAWGAKFGGTLAAWAAPTSANFTKVTSITAGTDLEATLCFKCHSSFYGTLPSSPSSSPAFQETDQAREFNPANPSFHPVLASAASLQGATSNIIAPWTKSSLMTCTDCHESNVTTDPNGPHGSAAKFILKGPNTTWNSALTLSTAGMPAGTFCANCHNANFTSSRYPAHTNSVHSGIACMACHVAIPHGSGHIGMLVSLPGGAGGNAVTDSAPYVGATVRLGIGSYPAATATWSNSNCGCGSVSNGH